MHLSNECENKFRLIHSKFISTHFTLSVNYTVLHIFAQVLVWAGNQSNSQNFDPSLLPKKLWLIFIWDEAKKNFGKKNPKWNWVFQNLQFSIIAKISGMGPWVSRINWCEEHWCSSIYMVVRLSDIRSKT